MRRLLIVLILNFVLVSAGCRKATPSPVHPPQTGNTSTTPSPIPAEPQPTPEPESNVWYSPVLGTDPIEYQGYRLTREVKTVKDVVTGRDTETDYGVLKFHSKTLMLFDADAFGGGNQLAFGLFSFLGTEHKQLYVERTGNREWEQWILDLYPHFHLVFHSTDYGFWGGMSVEDIDHDGVYELSNRVTDYYMFADLPHAASPEVFAILSYDRRAKKYVPANYLFQAEALEGNEENLASLHSKSGIDYRQQVLNILLTNLYAGKEREGWEFFETEYNQPDKAGLRRKIRKKLASEPVFRYLHPHRTS